MISVRSAKLSDVPRLIPMAKRFFEESEWKNTFGYTAKEDDTMFWLASAIKNPDFAFIVAENNVGPVGLLIARVNPWAMNLSQSCAYELFFYVDPNQRNGKVSKKLVDAYEKWAKAKGCNAAEFGVTEKMKGPKMAKFLMRHGFLPALRSHIKKLRDEFSEVEHG